MRRIMWEMSKTSPELFLVALVVCLHGSIALAGPRWERYYGGPANGYCVRPAPGGGYIVGGKRDFGSWLLRVDSLGDSLWAIRFRSDAHIRSVFLTDDSSWMVIGGYSTNHGDTSGFCFHKVSDSGETLWTRLYYDRGVYMGDRAVVCASDGGFLVVGLVVDTGGPGFAVEDGYAVRFDRDGNCLWSRRYVRGGADIFYSVVRVERNGFLLAGETFYDTSSTSDSAWFVRINDAGDTLWTRTYALNDISYQLFLDVAQTPDGGYVGAGGVSTDTSNADYFLVKTDSAGSVEWSRTYGGRAGDCAISVCVTPDSGYALVGQCSSFGAGGYDAWLVKTDAGGNVQWSRTFGGRSWDQGNDVETTPDGGFVITGETWSPPGGTEHLYLVKTDSSGSAAILEGCGRSASRERAVVALQLAPSVLIGPQATAGYSMPESGPVEIALYDITGQRLAVLASGHRMAGRHRETFTLPDRRGVGYVRIVTPSGSATAKLVMSGP